MTETSSVLATIYERNRRKRLTGWIIFYLLVVAIFALTVYLQAQGVNTLNFVNGALQLTTPKTKYTVGDTIGYTLKNSLSQPVTLVNTCPQEPLYVYTWTNNSWVRIHDVAAASVCAGEPKRQTIPVGGSYTQSFANWPHLFQKPGIYRIVGLATNYTALPYADFQVVAKPVAPTPPQIEVQIQKQVIIQKVITPVYVPVPSTGGGGGGGSADD